MDIYQGAPIWIVDRVTRWGDGSNTVQTVSVRTDPEKASETCDTRNRFAYMEPRDGEEISYRVSGPHYAE